MFNNENDVMKNLEDKDREFEIRKQAHMMMLEMMESISSDETKPIYALPRKVHSVTDKISQVMMLTLQMEDKAGYSVKACEFLGRVEEACAAFIEQAKDGTGEE